MGAGTHSAMSGKAGKYTWMTRKGWWCGCYGWGNVWKKFWCF